MIQVEGRQEESFWAGLGWAGTAQGSDYKGAVNA